MDSLDALLAEVHALGLRVNNLFELDGGQWQANLTDGLRFWDFGRAPSWGGALRQAIAKARTEAPGEAVPDGGQVLQVRTPGGPRASSGASIEDLGI